MQNTLQYNLDQVHQTMLARQKQPAHLMAVTKYSSIEQIQCLLQLGIRLLGENKVQDAIQKMSLFPDPSIQWHLIGHLQTNKVKLAVKHFACIQSVDSLKLLEKIDQSAQDLGKKMPILLQVKVAEDPNKYGFDPETLLKNKNFIFSLLNIEIRGIMLIVPYRDNPEDVRSYFRKGAELYQTLQQEYTSLSTLSMGMSHDYPVALDEGANLIRLGSLLFQ